MIDLSHADARFGIVRSISYGLFGPPEAFVPQVRKLGADVVRIYLYWSQIEPGPGEFTFDVVDSFLDQLDGSEEVWATVSSSSTWATRTATTFLPPSPAKDLDAYARFVEALVGHCAGRVHYWQCDNEPSNIGLLWAGNAEEYAAQLRVMYGAVKEADPDAAVVLGGMPFNVPSADPHSLERAFFDAVLQDAGDAFDVFDLHLYQQAQQIPADVESVRGMMRARGVEKPIVAGEYNAPWPELFPDAIAAMRETMAAVYSGKGQKGERAAVNALYERMDELPPTLQMFMRGCPPELEARRDRINAREIVMRNVLALSCGIRRTLCWDLAPDVPNYRDDRSVLDLLFGKLTLMSYEGTEMRPNPQADAFTRMTEHLQGAGTTTRVPIPDRPTLALFEIQRSERPDLWATWDQRDAFEGEDGPPVPFELPWPASSATATDVFGCAAPVEIENGTLRMQVSVDPIFIERA